MASVRLYAVQLTPPVQQLSTSEGVAVERVHPQTLQLMRQISENEKIDLLDFLASLLRYASVKQYAVFEDSHDCAVITFQSLQALSSSSGWKWGYTTTHKWIRILEAIGILERKRHKGHTEILFPLGAPAFFPSQALARLTTLALSPNVKVRQVVAKVKKRIEYLARDGQKELDTTSHQILSLLSSFVCQEGKTVDTEMGQKLYYLSAWIAYTVNPEKYPCPAQGHSFVPQVRNHAAQVSDGPIGTEKFPSACYQQGDFSGDVGNAAALQAAENPFCHNHERYSHRHRRKLPEEKGKSYSGHEIEGTVSCQSLKNTEGSLDLAESPSSTQHDMRRGVNEVVGQERQAVAFPEFPCSFEKRRGNSPVCPHEGNSVTARTCNVDRILSQKKKRKNDNVTHEEVSLQEQQGSLLATLVEGHTRNAHAYSHYLARYDRQTVLAVYIYTLQQVKLRKDGRCPIQSAGKYFTTMIRVWSSLGSFESACQAYWEAKEAGKTSRLPGIPADTQALVARFSTWSYEDIAEEMKHTAAPCEQHTLWNAQSFPSQSVAQEHQLEPWAPSSWMEGEAEAYDLVTRIEREALTIPDVTIRIIGIRPYRIRGTKRIAYLVDTWIDTMPEVFAAPEQWQEYYEGILALASSTMR